MVLIDSNPAGAQQVRETGVANCNPQFKRTKPATCRRDAREMPPTVTARASASSPPSSINSLPGFTLLLPKQPQLISSPPSAACAKRNHEHDQQRGDRQACPAHARPNDQHRAQASSIHGKIRAIHSTTARGSIR